MIYFVTLFHVINLALSQASDIRPTHVHGSANQNPKPHTHRVVITITITIIGLVPDTCSETKLACNVAQVTVK